ncbi:ketopantoate reductase-like protein [Mycena pura]|uniref:Ketopantoate reductase-like protein n=1 Tax=Mycena pura TaxID=153505 RepID=A0AAD6YP12_9AGAR|nr:ketopantoate reductase-like protein [Mycena pura]
MRFHVVGVGPLGTLVAHHLRRATPPAHPIIFLHSKEKSLRNAPTGFVLETRGSVTTSSGFEHDTFETEQNTTIESLFVTTRAYSTLHAIRRLVPRLSQNSTIVLAQNGLAMYDEIVRTLFRNPKERPHFIFASSTHSMFLSSAATTHKTRPTMLQPTVGTVDFAIAPDPHGRNFEAGFGDEAVHASERRGRLSDVARLDGDPSLQRYRSLRNTVAALLLAEPLNARWRPLAQVQIALRRKLVVNSVIHPLAALMGCRTADIFSTQYAVRIAKRICQEAADVFQTQLREDTKAWMASSETEVGGLMGIARLPPSLEAESMLRECLKVSQESKQSISSMLGSVRHGRMTEIDVLNGYLLKLGKTYSMQMPATATMYNLVRMRSAIPLDQIL